MNELFVRSKLGFAMGVAAFCLSGALLVGQTPGEKNSGQAKMNSARTAAANSRDVRLAEAVKAQDRERVRTLLKQHADVNTPLADGATALAWASHWDDGETAELLITAGANVNAANDYGVTPLSVACTNASAPLIERLLKAGANPNLARGTGETPLMRCARTGNADAVKMLLARGADANAKENRRSQTALMWAMSQKDPEVIRALIERGADVRARTKDGFTPLMFAAEQGNIEGVRLVLEAGASVNDMTPEDGSALTLAIINGHEELSIYLLDKGADANVADGKGVTALHYALLKGLSMTVGVQVQPFNGHMFRPNMLETVKALLAHGANPNARVVKAPVNLKHAHNTGQRSGLAEGATPFYLAAFTTDTAVMRALIAAGADPNLGTNDGVTPLMAAVGLGRARGGYESWRWRQTGHLDVTEESVARNTLDTVKLVLELGADVNAANKNGETALHSAAHDGTNDIIQVLAEKGADLNAKDKLGQTPLSIAEGIVPTGPVDISLVTRIPHKSTADLLLKLGAKPLEASAKPNPGQAPKAEGQ